MDIQWLLNEYKSLKDKPNSTQHEEGQLYILKFIAETVSENSMVVDLSILEKMIEVINFYGHPGTYVGIALIGDPPCGELMEDISDAGCYGDKPGKTAREAAEFLEGHKQFADEYHRKIEEKYADPESVEDEPEQN
jgi:hypothetical protein